MTDDFNLPLRAPCRRISRDRRNASRRLALSLFALTSIIAATSVARAAQPQPTPKIEAIPKLQPIPKRTGHVTDTAKVLLAGDREHLEKMLAQYERETFHQLAVLTIPTLAGEAVDAFTRRALSAWKLGQPGLDNGVLVTMAMKEQLVRIELGAAMKKFISNDAVEAVIEKKMIPAFSKGEFAAGLQAGLEELMRLGRKFVVKKEDVERAKRK
jgi:uncharacterized protein